MAMAYSRRDSLECKDVYDSSYVGTSEDLGNPPGTPPILLTYADEVSHVAALARTATISSIFCDLGSPASWTRLGSNSPSHPEWAMIQIAGSNIAIQVTDGVTSAVAGGSNLFFEFAFNPSTPVSPTDTTWKIVRWTETRSP